MSAPRHVRRARPALGTLVELGACATAGKGSAGRTEAAFRAAWAAIEEVERAMSRFRPDGDVGRFNASRAGESLRVSEHTAAVLSAAAALARETAGAFDVSVGTGPDAWTLSEDGGGAWLHKLTGEVRLDLGGIAKGYAVDRAFEALEAELADDEAAWWVNAGGDLRVRGVELPVSLRDERGGGAWPWMRLREGALATSWFGSPPLPRRAAAHVSVVSPRCLWSDALTKVVALSGRTDHRSLSSRGATAWLHPAVP